jgi:hypothetical protein
MYIGVDCSRKETEVTDVYCTDLCGVPFLDASTCRVITLNLLSLF